MGTTQQAYTGRRNHRVLLHWRSGLGLPLNNTGKFAEILARATTLFGSQAAAEQWLEQPATGLDQRRPIDLVTTPAGLELVEDFLGRIEYGVYT
jgi:putative toxin-antitoxin system antitoxin component (TIGR02293 family)